MSELSVKEIANIAYTSMIYHDEVTVHAHQSYKWQELTDYQQDFFCHLVMKIEYNKVNGIETTPIMFHNYQLEWIKKTDYSPSDDTFYGEDINFINGLKIFIKVVEILL